MKIHTSVKSADALNLISLAERIDCGHLNYTETDLYTVCKTLNSILDENDNPAVSLNILQQRLEKIQNYLSAIENVRNKAGDKNKTETEVDYLSENNPYPCAPNKDTQAFIKLLIDENRELRKEIKKLLIDIQLISVTNKYTTGK